MTNPSQGLNLGGQPQAYGDTFSALDLMHGADAWIIVDEQGNETRNAVALDDKGWPTALPLVDGQPHVIAANVFYTKIIPAGDYIVEWQGEGTLTTYSPYDKISDNKFVIHFDGDYSKGDNGITLLMEATDPNHTGNHLHDIKVYDAKHADLIAMGEHFNPKWFQQIDDFRVLRTHDWQGTNSSQVTDWGQNVVTADQALWIKDGRGMPYELLVEVANQSKSDLWINIPHMATDDYIRNAAAYVKEHLDPSLRVYVEYTNEYWTDSFGQHQYLIDKGATLFGNADFANAQAYGARASQMTLIFKDVFGDQQARLFPTVTLNHDAFNNAEAITMLTTPAYVAQGGVSPLDAGIRFLATDGYLTWYNTSPETDAMVDDWMTHKDGGFGSARDFLLDQLKNNLAPAWAIGRNLADKYHLGFGVYEGGALLINGNDFATANPKYTNFNEAVQLSPQMKQVYEAELAAWQKVGGGPFAWYADTGRWGFSGDYGLWNAPDFKPELRTEAIIAANKNYPAWWTGDTRPASTFDNGKYDAGTAKADKINGTALDDRLYGLAGNDKLSGLSGKDILVGGDGNDNVSGGQGDDVLVGGAGADKLDGGKGFDFASFQTSTRTVSVDLQSRKGQVGDASGDVLKNIEGLIGGSATDMLFGNASGNWLDGGDGKDQLTGRAGDDRLNGGSGDDTLSGGKGNDLFYLGPGQDKVTDWLEGDHIAVATGNGWSFGDPTLVVIEQIGADTHVKLVHGAEIWELSLQNTVSSTISVSDDFLFS